jgi:hypothetical protein
MRFAELSCSAISYSRSILSADVSILAKLVGIPAFLKKGVAANLGVDLALGEAKDLGNNISTGHWFMPISNRFCLHSFHSFM